MKAKAVARNVKISAQKARLVADLIRGKDVDYAHNQLRFINKKAASIVLKVFESAIANAENNLNADVNDLFVKEIYVDGGPVLKRFSARARGRGDRILKRMCHVTVILGDLKDN